MHKNGAFDAKIVNTRLTKIFIAIFAPDERLPSSATLIGKPLSSSAGLQMIDLWPVSFSELTCLWRQVGRTTRVCVAGNLPSGPNRHSPHRTIVLSR